MLLLCLLSTAGGMWAEGAWVESAGERKAEGGWQGRVLSEGQRRLAVVGCWCPACPSKTLVSRGGLGLAGQELGAGVLLGLLAACWVPGCCLSRDRR